MTAPYDFARRSEVQRARYARDPDIGKRHSETMTLLHAARPDVRQRQAVSIRKTLAKKRAFTPRLRRRREKPRLQKTLFPGLDKRAGYLKGRFGLSLAAHDRLLLAQDGRCAICRRTPTRRVLDVDHRHGDGLVRGLLCSSCNMGIGHFRDSPEVLDAAAAYLRRTLQ